MDLTPSRHTRVYVIEAQELLVPELVEIFELLNARVDYITRDIDIAYISSQRPDLIFLDGDYVSEGLDHAIRQIWNASSQTNLIVYCSPATANRIDDRYVWMTAGVIPKSAGRQRLCRLLERAMLLHHG